MEPVFIVNHHSKIICLMFQIDYIFSYVTMMIAITNEGDTYD
jgi:hypothetical protein